MLRRILLGVMWAVLLVPAALNTACSMNNEPKPAALTGEQAHERHATGIDSQVNDK